MDERAPMPAAPEEDVWFVSAGGMLMRKGDTRGFVIPADMIASLRAALARSAAGTVALDTEAILQDMEQCGGCWREYAAHFRAVLARPEPEAARRWRDAISSAGGLDVVAKIVAKLREEAQWYRDMYTSWAAEGKSLDGWDESARTRDKIADALEALGE